MLIGEGQKTFRLEVMHPEMSTKVWDVSTDEETIGSALYELGLTDDENFFTIIDGVRADFTEDGYWWAFYINGEMAMQGVGETEIKEGVIYAFVYTPA